MQTQEFQLSQAQYDDLIAASQPVPYLLGSGGVRLTGSAQENANRAWERLGAELGFKPMSVRPSNKGRMFFTAEVADAKAPA